MLYSILFPIGCSTFQGVVMTLHFVNIWALLIRDASFLSPLSPCTEDLLNVWYQGSAYTAEVYMYWGKVRTFPPAWNHFSNSLRSLKSDVYLPYSWFTFSCFTSASCSVFSHYTKRVKDTYPEVKDINSTWYFKIDFGSISENLQVETSKWQL